MVLTQRTRIILAVAILCMSLPLAAFAQSGIPDQIVPCKGTDCTICHLGTLAQNVLNTGIFIVIFLSAVLFAWAGWKLLTSQGNSEQYGDAKRIFTNVVIGLVIILAAWLVIDTLMYTITGSHLWNKIC